MDCLKRSYVNFFSDQLTIVSRRSIAIALLAVACVTAANGQTASSPTPTPSPAAALSQTAADHNESERSDKLTGGHIEVAEFAADQPDIRLTLNIPSFRLTLWQNGKQNGE